MGRGRDGRKDGRKGREKGRGEGRDFLQGLRGG